MRNEPFSGTYLGRVNELEGILCPIQSGYIVIERVYPDGSADRRPDIWQAEGRFGQGALPYVVKFTIAEVTRFDGEALVDSGTCHWMVFNAKSSLHSVFE